MFLRYQVRPLVKILIFSSDKQHRGNTGEGQFHLKNSNIQYHINKYLYTKMDYNKLWELLNE